MNLKIDVLSKIVPDSSEYAKKRLESKMEIPFIGGSGPVNVNEMTDNDGEPTSQAYQIAVNKMNEFMEATNKNSKFIFHEGLEKYYVEIVDAMTNEVVKEIPPKELLDAYYEMQKMVGKIVDRTI